MAKQTINQNAVEPLGFPNAGTGVEMGDTWNQACDKLAANFSELYAAGAGIAMVNTALTTVGAGAISAAAITGKMVSRGGAQSATGFTDTTATALLIIAAQSGLVGSAWSFLYRNNTDAPATITGGVGVTVSGITIVPANSWARFLVTYATASTVTMVGTESGPNEQMPLTQYATAALQSTVMTGAQVAGGAVTVFENTGTTPANLQAPTADQIIAAIPNAQIGMSYLLKIRNSSSGANTATITTNTGITLTGTMTIAQNVTRDFLVTYTAASTVTIRSIGISAAGL